MLAVAICHSAEGTLFCAERVNANNRTNVDNVSFMIFVLCAALIGGFNGLDCTSFKVVQSFYCKNIVNILYPFRASIRGKHSHTLPQTDSPIIRAHTTAAPIRGKCTLLPIERDHTENTLSGLHRSTGTHSSSTVSAVQHTIPGTVKQRSSKCARGSRGARRLQKIYSTTTERKCSPCLRGAHLFSSLASLRPGGGGRSIARSVVCMHKPAPKKIYYSIALALRSS